MRKCQVHITYKIKRINKNVPTNRNAFVGAGRGSRTPISTLARWHNSRYTIPAHSALLSERGSPRICEAARTQSKAPISYQGSPSLARAGALSATNVSLIARICPIKSWTRSWSVNKSSSVSCGSTDGFGAEEIISGFG